MPTMLTLGFSFDRTGSMVTDFFFFNFAVQLVLKDPVFFFLKPIIIFVENVGRTLRLFSFLKYFY